MNKIWYRNPSKSEVIGRCGGDEKTRMTTQNQQKSNAKKKFKKISTLTRLVRTSRVEILKPVMHFLVFYIPMVSHAGNAS